MTRISILMAFDQETKGAVKYREILADGSLAQYPNSPGARIGVQYIRKFAFAGNHTPDGGFPKKILLSVEEAD